jgi:WD40 repeat protein
MPAIDLSSAAGELQRELRRGSSPATVLSVSFSPCAKYLAMTSNKETIHIFGLVDGTGTGTDSGKSWRYVLYMQLQSHPVLCSCPPLT